MINVYGVRSKLIEEPVGYAGETERIDEAIEVAWTYSSHPGEASARYVIDQMLRALLGPDAYDAFVTAWEASGEQRWDVGTLP